MSNIPCFLIPALVGLISAILGYLLGKMFSSKANIEVDANANNRNSFSADATNTLKADLDACKENTTKLNAKISALQTELDSHKAKAASSQSFVSASSEKKSTESKASNKTAASKKAETKSTQSLSTTSGFDSNSATAAYGKKVKLDDLKIVEGIGPKIEGLYNAAGINTWKALSETSFDRSRQILDAAGERYAIHNPTTWPKQALLAHEGKFAELKTWQENLNGGKE
jgi:predicted flap endonuclease-1-like 5' DNA nuclease